MIEAFPPAAPAEPVDDAPQRTRGREGAAH